jgi:hypothetical protein
MSMTALRLLGSVSVAMLFFAASSVHAATVQEIFEKFGLLGNWSVDCTKPASPQNPYLTHRALGSDRVERGPILNSASPSTLFVVDQAAEVKPNEVAFSFNNGKTHVKLVVRVEHNRMRTMERSYDNGEGSPILGGREANRDTPWFNKCN